ncbi:MAG: thioredoxin reductase [SAR202 cluster bacterium]|nr:thioredoxin reductase [SAR202 cluster bacterium]
MTTETKNYDVLIAGQGAAAFAAGLYTARYQMKSIIVGETFGGETATGGLIENYPGYSEIDGFDLMMKFREQVASYDVPILDDKVSAVKKDSNDFQIETESGEKYIASSVILGIGRERRKLGLQNEDEWTGKGVSFCSTCDAPLHRENIVAIVGGGNAAIEGAVLLSKYASTVYLIYRRNKFTRPEPVNLKLLNDSKNIIQLLDTNVTSLLGDDGLNEISIDKPYNNSTNLNVDGLFIEIGADPRVEIPIQLGINLNEKNEVIVNNEMETNVAGILAAGDLTDASGDLKQTITAAAQGAIAAKSAYTYVSNKNVGG